MDVSEQISKFKEFIELTYHGTLLEKARVGEKFLVIDFSDLSKFDPALADLLLETPEEVIKAGERAIEQFELPEAVKGFKLRIKNLPKNQKILIKNIRSEHLNKLISIEGLVRQKSDVRPQVTIAKFECPECGNTIPVIQTESTFKEPTKCSCGRKGRFKLIDKELIDAQKLVIEESPEDLEGGEQPKRINTILKGDLVSPLSEKKTNPGSKIEIIGLVKEVSIIAKTGAKSTLFDLIIDANYVEGKEESYGEIEIKPEEEIKIKEIAKDKDCMKNLVTSIAPSIYGHDEVKEALLLQMLSGVRKKRDDGTIIRGDIHILLLGDPGSGKSQLLKRITNVAPKSRYVSGKGASGAGLTAAVVKDEFLKGWSLEAGALTLTNKGLCAVDEFDKMSEEDRDAMHEALEQQTVSIAKANIQATLRAETTVLAAANPKLSRFDLNRPIGEQIDLPSTIISRFDLIFPIKDIPDKVKDEKMADFILTMHQDTKVQEVAISTEMLRKYIAYAKQRISPKLTKGAFEEIKEYYVSMRGMSTVEGGFSQVTITARQLEALVRLSEASAKAKLSDKVTRKDAQRAKDLVHYSLAQFGMDKETGRIDIDRIITGVPASQRNKIIKVKEIIEELERKTKPVPVEDIVKEAEKIGISRSDTEETIQKLIRSGDIYEPRKEFVQKLS